MRFEEALYAYLTADPGIEELVGERIYPKRLPEGAVLPAISWFRASASRIYTHDPFEATDAWVKARIQFNCWAKDMPDDVDPDMRFGEDVADRVGNAVILALSGYDGDMGGQYIGSSMVSNEIDEYEVPAKFYRRIVDIMMSYEEDESILSSLGAFTSGFSGGFE